jgi:hypothetical protein
LKIFPVSGTILLPVAPTIAGAIADYLRLLTQVVYGHLSQDCDNTATKLPQDLAWYWQFEKSIRLVPTSQYQYVSTIAHRLSANSALSPLEICQNLELSITVAIITDKNVDRCSWLELDCWYNEAGYIYFQLVPSSIDRWLNYIHDLPLNFHLARLAEDRLAASVSIALYAHQRCCSILNLARSEGLVAITDNWQTIAPDWWVDRSAIVNPDRPQNQCPAASTSIFEHLAERQLVHALMAVLDGIYSHSVQSEGNRQFVPTATQPIQSAGTAIDDRTVRIRSPNWMKLTIDLAQSWLEFYRYCRIFGDINTQYPGIAIARCGLTAISRRYLQVLLENYLGIKVSI